MRLYIGSSSAEDLEQQPNVERRDYHRNRIGKQPQPASIHELSHFRFVGRESHERKYRERELHAEYHLTQHEKLRRSARSIHDCNYRGRNDRDAAGDQSPQPRANANVEETLHYDLTRERSRERRVLT